MCGAARESFATQPAAKRRVAGKIAVGIGAAVVAVTLFMMAPALLGFIAQQAANPAITILRPQIQGPSTIPREELVQHALDLINKDRADSGLSPVKLSSNQAAQVHAEDVFKTKRISHWMTNGEKPYMTYTRFRGEGSVQQNIAIAGFSADQYEKCRTNILLNCEIIVPDSTIGELEYEMMYKDAECCNNGHRDNILDPHHTNVSIGIVYDKYYLVFVENFENNYGLNVEVNNGQVRISGDLLRGNLEQISVNFDAMPTPAVYEENKHLLSYSAGELVSTIVKPLPPGYYYEKPQGYSLIQATSWGQGNAVNVTFNLAPAVKDDGVYTLFAMVKDGEDTFDATSYSIFVHSEGS